MKKLCLTSLILITMAAAQVDKPNFSGSWQLDLAKSDVSEEFLIGQAFWVEHKEPKLIITSIVKNDRGEHKAEYNFTTDGQETTNVDASRTFKTKTGWQEKSLVFKTLFTSPGIPSQIDMGWNLSDDGKTLNIFRIVVLSGRAVIQKLVFTKK